MQAGPREQAKQMHDRLTGVLPSEAVLLQMQAQIEMDNIDSIGGATPSAAEIAMDNEAFYAATLKVMAAPWTNRDFDPFVPLDDLIATYIGVVRDGLDYRRIMFDDIVYVSNSNSVRPYSSSDNNHYLDIESQGLSLRDTLVQAQQSAVSVLPAEATAGIMTTRSAARSFFIAGTNRAMFRFMLISQMCIDLEELEDTTGVPNRIRQDVSRSPGGDSRLFTNGCVGCHTGMDPLAQAFAYYDYDMTAGRITYNLTPQPNPELGIDTRVVPKYHINAGNFPFGFVTPDDSWENYWRDGPNRSLGWDVTNAGLPGLGSGASSMGQELANSRQFAQCQVEKVFETVCLREPGDDTDQQFVINATASFISPNNGGVYNLKKVFAETANYCKGN